MGVKVAGIVAMLMLTGCSGSPEADQLTVAGRITVPGLMLEDGDDQVSTPCGAATGYDDVRPGTQVLIEDGKGEALGLARLELGFGPVSGRKYDEVDCTFEFITDVPAGRTVYKVEVAHRGQQVFTEAELTEQVIELTLG